VNAVTRSGANHWEGAVSSYLQNQSLTGVDPGGLQAQAFRTKEVALTIGGPIVRDRAAFFVDAGLQRFVGARGLSIRWRAHLGHYNVVPPEGRRH
jgi:hypothetical protein